MILKGETVKIIDLKEGVYGGSIMSLREGIYKNRIVHEYNVNVTEKSGSTKTLMKVNGIICNMERT